MMRYKNYLFIVFILILIASFSLLYFHQLPFITSSPTSPSKEIIYGYIEHIEKQKNDYSVSVIAVDMLSLARGECTSNEQEATATLPLCNPNGYLLQNEHPIKTYRVKNPSMVMYEAMVAVNHEWTDQTARISFDEFYLNYIGQAETIRQKNMYFRPKEEKGLYSITLENNEIKKVQGYYTP